MSFGVRGPARALPVSYLAVLLVLWFCSSGCGCNGAACPVLTLRWTDRPSSPASYYARRRPFLVDLKGKRPISSVAVVSRPLLQDMQLASL